LQSSTPSPSTSKHGTPVVESSPVVVVSSPVVVDEALVELSLPSPVIDTIPVLSGSTVVDIVFGPPVVLPLPDELSVAPIPTPSSPHAVSHSATTPPITAIPHRPPPS
jgi:hypothetical protein